MQSAQGNERESATEPGMWMDMRGRGTPVCIHAIVSSAVGRREWGVPGAREPRRVLFIELNPELDGLDEVAPRDRLVR